MDSLAETGNQNGVKTPFFLLFSFFFSSIGLLCTRKKALTVKKMTVFAISFPATTRPLKNSHASRMKAAFWGYALLAKLGSNFKFNAVNLS
jgi:hypothetical protein